MPGVARSGLHNITSNDHLQHQQHSKRHTCEMCSLNDLALLEPFFQRTNTRVHFCFSPGNNSNDVHINRVAAHGSLRIGKFSFVFLVTFHPQKIQSVIKRVLTVECLSA